MALETIGERAEGDLLNGNGKRGPFNMMGTVYAKRANNNGSNQTSGTHCNECNTFFIRPYTFRRHMDVIHGATSRYECDQEGCGESFKRKDILSRHKDMQHGDGKVLCQECGKSIRKDGLRDHQKTKICLDNRITLNSNEPAVSEFRKPKTIVRTEQEVNDQVEAEAEVWMHDQAASHFESVGQVADKMQIDHEVTNLDHLDVTTEDAMLPDPEPAPVRIIPETATQMELPELASYVPQASHTPEIVPDSPRPVGKSFSPMAVFLSEGQSVEDLASDVETQLVALKEAGAFANPVDAKSRAAEFLETSRPSRRFYKMSRGSGCALCEQPLSHSLDSFFQHAKSHLQLRDQPRLECLTCKIDFAFEIDLKLHSSKLEIWSFCREMPPVHAHDDSDWLATTAMQDRASFINLLRRWESLQQHWYWSAILKFLTRPSPLRVGSRTEISAPLLRLRDRTSANTTVSLVDNRDISILAKRFSETTLDNGSNGKSVNCRGSRRHDNILSARQRLWETAETNPKSFGEALGALRWYCEDDVAYKKILEIALHEASSKGHITMIQNLLDAGVEIDAVDDAGSSALLSAIEKKQIKSARLLIERGADVHYRFRNGDSALRYACLPAKIERHCAPTGRMGSKDGEKAW